MVNVCVEHEENGNVTVHGICPVCRKEWAVKTTEAAWEAYKRGALAQAAFPDMPLAERELLISGVCDDCFKKMFQA